jgi:hypothetical protein
LKRTLKWYRSAPARAAVPSVMIPLVLVLLAAGCSETTPPPAQGSIRVHLVDSPARFDAVTIAARELSAHSSGSDSSSGWIVLDSTPRTIDLLSLTNGSSLLLADTPLPVGHYTQLRLKLADESTVTVDAAEHPLDVPSGLQSGLKLNHPFDIEANTVYEITLDFDAERSIHVTGSHRYMLRPVIRVVATQTSGSISGVLSPSTADAIIFTLAGADTVGTRPGAGGAFRLSPLPPGLYAVSIQPVDPGYSPSVLAGIEVAAGHDTNLGTIVLH